MLLENEIMRKTHSSYFKAKRAERRYAPTPCLFHQLKHFLVFTAHAVTGAENFFFVEGIRLQFLDELVARFDNLVQRINLFLVEFYFFCNSTLLWNAVLTEQQLEHQECECNQGGYSNKKTYAQLAMLR